MVALFYPKEFQIFSMEELRAYFILTLQAAEKAGSLNTFKAASTVASDQYTKGKAYTVKTFSVRITDRILTQKLVTAN